MLSFLFALSRRFHQPTGLAVVVTPLAFLVCCALAGQALGSVQAIALHRDYCASDSSTGQLQAVNATSLAADKAACYVAKVAWPLGKSQLARRITERWAPGLLVSFGASSFEPSLVAGPTTPKVSDSSSPEYLTLRRLRL
jgi:hypothetical protein